MSENTTAYAPERAEQIKTNYDRVIERIRAAEQDHSGVRTAKSQPVQLVTVTKFFPASDVAALYSAGVRLFGENRDQEAGPKATQVRALEIADDPARWVFIGQLQTNKAKSVVKYAQQVQSVDRLSLVDALAKAYRNQLARFEAEEGQAPAAHRAGGLDCLIQVSLADEATAGQGALGARGGVNPQGLLEVAERIAGYEYLNCGGVMAVAPLETDPNAAFEKLWGLAQKLQGQVPQATQISAGMSADVEHAVRWGSTCVRVGSAIMGTRPVR